MDAASAPALRSRLWQGYGAVAFVLSIGYFLAPDGSDPQLVIYQLLGLAAPIAMVAGVLLYRPTLYHHWLLFAGGLAFWIVGDGYWDSYRWLLHEQAPFPSPADIAYLAAYPLLIGGVLVLFRGWGRPRLGDLLDGAIIAVAAAMIATPILLEPVLASGSNTFETVLVVGTPVADFVMAMAFVQLIFRRGVPNFSLRCVMLAIVSLLVADSVYSFLNLTGSYTSGMAIDAGWLVTYSLLGVAPLHPSMAAMREVSEHKAAMLSIWRIAVLIAAVLAAPLALIGDVLAGGRVGILELGTILVLILLVGARFLLLQRERNEMQAALAVSERELRELFKEADDARTALASQNDQLRELDTLKDDLIALVSHELRTPLTSIVGYLDLVVEDEDALTEEQQGFLEVVGRNSKRLLSLVSDLLFVAQSEAGRMTLKQQPLSLRDLVAQAVAAAEPTAQQRKIDLTVACPDSGDVVGDEQRLGQVVDNLLSNALKFTPPGGSVAVTVTTTKDTVLLEVVDSGFGISDEEQQLLFTRFFRTDAAMKRAIQGTGLGLSIVKAIVEGHGGTISVESAEGEGATFRVALPTAASIRNEPIEAAA